MTTHRYVICDNGWSLWLEPHDSHSAGFAPADSFIELSGHQYETYAGVMKRYDQWQEFLRKHYGKEVPIVNAAPAPYEYKGMLRPWLELILQMRKEGKTRQEVAQYLLDSVAELQAHRTSQSNAGRDSLATSIRAIEKHMGNPFNAPVPCQDYGRARREHAGWLRDQGFTYGEIGTRLGVSGVRARQIVEYVARQRYGDWND